MTKNNTTITRKDALNVAIAALAENGTDKAIVDKLRDMLKSLETKKRVGDSDVKIANRATAHKVADFLAKAGECDGKTITDKVPGIMTPQKLTQVVRVGIAEGFIVKRYDDKGKPVYKAVR